MPCYTYHIPRKGAIVLLLWATLCSGALFVLLQLWGGALWHSGGFTRFAAWFCFSFCLLLLLVWWRCTVFCATFCCNGKTLTLQRGIFICTHTHIPLHCVYAHKRIYTPLLRCFGCCVLLYDTAGCTFVLPPLANKDATELCHLFNGSHPTDTPP